MKTVFNKAVRDDLIARINSLSENSTAQWGKMNVYQMLKHCTIAEEMYLGKTQYKRTLLGRIFGKMALKGLLKDEKPMGRNAPTSSHFIVTETGGDIFSQKQQWIGLIEEYGSFSKPEIEHWFFGRMSKEQIGLFVYKHTDHHLRQFGA